MPNELRHDLAAALAGFQTKPLADAAIDFWGVLGYRSELRLQGLSTSPQLFPAEFDIEDKFRPEKALASDWKSVHFLFQITDNELAATHSVFGGNIDRTTASSYLFFAIDLKPADYARGKLAQIARELNRPFASPILLVVRNGRQITIAIVDRRAHKRTAAREVLERVTLIKDIDTSSPHAAHVRILEELELHGLSVATWGELHSAWRAVLDLSELNRKFFQELSNWYFWARDIARFPAAVSEDDRSIAMIRLLTRAIFVYFIKERALVPKAFFDTSEIPSILVDAAAGSGTYYNAVLQNLFFAALNAEPATRGWKDESKSYHGRDDEYLDSTKRRYKEMFRDPASVGKLFGRVPFLNGGLFECLDSRDDATGTEIRYDGFSSKPQKRAHVPNLLFWGPDHDVDLNGVYQTTGRTSTVHPLLVILNRYKFTVTENLPLEEEVALDPELLGKVFENLLASYNPETATTARKQTGSFYTPREIVEFMVEGALVAYLEVACSGVTRENIEALVSYDAEPPDLTNRQRRQIIEAIGRVTILDPACGSGAFPMGCLHRLTHMLQRLDRDGGLWKAEQQRLIDGLAIAESRVEAQARLEEAIRLDNGDYVRKLYLIERSLFGVDKQPIAVQIAKLRFFISLIIEQRLDANDPARDVQPLPNLETKIVAANSIVRRQLNLNSPDSHRLERDLSEVRRRHFSAQRWSDKKVLRERDKALREELAAELRSIGMDRRHAEEMAAWNPYDQNEFAPFFDVEWMFGTIATNGFDVVIGNPPYVKEYTHRGAFDGVRDSKYYQGKMDIWYLFACRAFDMLAPETGVLSFIATNNWTTSSGASILRNTVATRVKMLKYIDFMDYKVFGSAAIQTMVLIARNTDDGRIYSFDLRRITSPLATRSDLTDLLSGTTNPKLEYILPEFDRDKLRSTTFTFSGDKIAAVLSEIDSARSINLFDGEIAQGIVAPQDFVNRNAAIAIGGDVAIGEGIFFLSRREVNQMSLGPDDMELIRPLYTTTELGRYSAERENRLFVIYTDSRFRNPAQVTRYPGIRRHLDRFATVITSDNAPYGLHRARDERFFVGTKIVAVRKCAQPSFTYTDFDCYVSQTFNVIKSVRFDLKFLTGLFNSRLVAFWLRHRGKMQGAQYQVDKAPLLAIPIIDMRRDEQAPISALVDVILRARSANPEADISEIDRKIDAIVYTLYGLSPESIAVLEGESD